MFWLVNRGHGFISPSIDYLWPTHLYILEGMSLELFCFKYMGF